MTKTIVKLQDYDANWSVKFNDEKSKIKYALGDKMIGIEHIGSTSVKGLKAKPIIDILVGVQNLEEITIFAESLKEIEYEYVHKPELKGRKFFRKGIWGKGSCHLHICVYKGEEWNTKIMFRDYLRMHPKVAEEYALLKTELAKKYQFDRPTYTQKKEPFIARILQKAMQEKY
ncbi:GrpB family protein [Rummeliibacillus pycnus]|uniref:GrpB family protein n=1 Tax=Rummeliibacillus pycnus TaxID=101070 RepID=UPI0037C7C9D2